MGVCSLLAHHVLVMPSPAAAGSHARAVFEYAKAMVYEAGRVMMPHNGQPVCLRVGIHTGPIVSGIIGSRMPKFCLYVAGAGGASVWRGERENVTNQLIN